jgi:hypothetical protein
MFPAESGLRGAGFLEGDIPRAVLTLLGERGGGVTNERLVETRTTICFFPASPL